MIVDIRTGTKTDKLLVELKNVADNLKKELGVVSWKTARAGKRFIAKDVSSQIKVKQADVKALIREKRGDTEASVSLKKTSRMPLKRFSPRQTKKGVTYRIEKQGKRQLLRGGFMGPKPGVIAAKLHGHVWIRKGYMEPGTSGPRIRGRKQREPIYIPRGPSPYGVVLKGERKVPIANEIRQELKKQLATRIRYLRLKQSGVI